MNARPYHFDFPLRADASGRIASATHEQYLRGLIEAVLFTRPGERVNRPDFGSGVHALVFAAAGDELAHATQTLVQSSLQRWLTELLRVDDVSVVADDSALNVTITYVPVGEGAQRVLTVKTPGGAS